MKVCRDVSHFGTWRSRGNAFLFEEVVMIAGVKGSESFAFARAAFEYGVYLQVPICSVFLYAILCGNTYAMQVLCTLHCTLGSPA